MIEQQVLQLHHHRAMWRSMSEAVVMACEHGDANYFLDHYTLLYVDGATMSVRRLAVDRGGRQEISLGILLRDIAANPEAITRTSFLDRYAGHDDPRDWARADWLRRGQQAWDRSWGVPQLEHLDPARVQADLHSLQSTAEKVRRFADRTVAHIDSRGAGRLPTFTDLDAAIDSIGELFKRYCVLLTGSGWAFLEPAVQGDWKRPFRKPLFEPYAVVSKNDLR